MENKIQIFEHEKFGKIRGLVLDEQIWFVAADVCRILELANPTDILKRLDEDEKCKVPESRVVVDPILNIGSEKRKINMVNEPGLYRLIFASRKKEAREFQRWVYHEVLPSIRKTGSYSLVAKTKYVPNPNRVAGQFSDAAVYVSKASNNTVKVGQSKNVECRKSNIKSKKKITLGETHKTSLLPRKIARSIEKAFKETFSSFRVDGEFFNIDFKTACNFIDAEEKLIANLPNISDFEKLLKATNSIVGKNAD